MTAKILGVCTLVLILTSLCPELLEPLCFRIIYPWGWLTYQFAHVSVLHLTGNFLFGLPFMLYLEHKVGAAKLLNSYLLCGVGSALMFGLMVSFNAGMVGSSGSISGMAAMAAMSFGERPLDKLLALLFCAVQLGLQVAMAVFYGGFSNVAYWGHVGGMLTGVALVLRTQWMKPARKR